MLGTSNSLWNGFGRPSESVKSHSVLVSDPENSSTDSDSDSSDSAFEKKNPKLIYIYKLIFKNILPESDSESSVSESSSVDSESCSVLEITFLLCGQRFFR